MPSVVFSSPEVAIVGITEDAAVDQHKNVQVFKSEFTCGAPSPAHSHPAALESCAQTRARPCVSFLAAD